MQDLITESLKRFDESGIGNICRSVLTSVENDMLRRRLEQELKSACEKRDEEWFICWSKLCGYAEHDYKCIRSQAEAGEPIEGGGYRQRFAGKWYQSSPIDETPKCDCGLSEIIPPKGLIK
jgi:hypothetical protein